MIYSIMQNSIFNILQRNIERGEEISPLLCFSSNLELLHADILVAITTLFEEYRVDKQSLFYL